MSFIRSFFRKNIDEIRADPALRLYGVCLGISFLITYFWILYRHRYLFIVAGSEPICWPFFPACYATHIFSAHQAQWITHIYGALSLAFVVAFLRKKITAGYALLLAASVYEVVLFSQDFRFRQNEHYMLLWAAFTFLLIPRKREAVPLLIILFYVWAARLKMNAEWLSGADLYLPLWFTPPQWAPALCKYVIVLEFVFVWGLICRGWLFWASFIQFVLFHIESYSQVSFFYPILMSGILSIYPLLQFFPGANPTLRNVFSFRLAKSTYALMAVFSLCQLVPHLYPGDPALTGQGRILALHMFEARQRCVVYAVEKFREGPSKTVNLFWRDLPPRTACEPIIYFNRAKNLCRNAPGMDPQFVDLDFHMSIARSTDPVLKPLISVSDFCSKNLAYNVVLPNKWILPVSSESN